MIQDTVVEDKPDTNNIGTQVYPEAEKLITGDSTQQESYPKCVNTSKHLPKTIEKMEAVKVLVGARINTKKALQLVGYKPGSVPAMQTRFKKFFLTTPVLLKKGKVASEKMLDDYIANSPAGDAKIALRLIEMQQERLDPVVNKHQIQSQSLNISITADQRSDIIRSLRRYKSALPPDMEGLPQDIVVSGQVECEAEGNEGQDVTIDK